MSDVYITGELAAAFLRVSRSTMLRLAKSDEWKVQGERRATRYLAEDVCKTAERMNS